MVAKPMPRINLKHPGSMHITVYGMSWGDGHCVVSVNIYEGGAWRGYASFTPDEARQLAQILNEEAAEVETHPIVRQRAAKE